MCEKASDADIFSPIPRSGLRNHGAQQPRVQALHGNFPISKASQLEWAEENGGELETDRTLQLLNRYGTLASEVIDFVHAANKDENLLHSSDYSKAEIQFLVEREHVVHLSDIVHRRTSLAFTGKVNKELLVELSEIVGAELGWSSDQKAQEVQGIQLESVSPV